MATKITLEGLSDELKQTISKYFDNVNKVVPETLNQLAENTRTELRKTSPRNRYGGGTYANGWQWEYKKQSLARYSVVVYNGGKHRTLTHLLEDGHATVNGGFVPGQKHIAPARDNAEKALIKDIETKLGSINV